MHKRKKFLIVLFFLSVPLCAVIACQPASLTPLALTPTPPQTSTPTPSATPVPVQQPIFQTFAFGQVLPDMRVPIQRGSAGEGGWYVIIGSQEGWAQFLSRMGQPTAIWQPVNWEKEVLIGALLGLRQGREQQIEIIDLITGGIEVLVTVQVNTLTPTQAVNQITYPFHMVRVPRIELPLGPATFRFVNTEGAELAVQTADVSDIDLVWLNGAQALFPTPTPAQTRTMPPPTATATPVPNLQVRCIVLDVLPEQRTLRIVSEVEQWQNVTLAEGVSILQAGQSISPGQLEPGMTLSVLGYAGKGRDISAVHIDVLEVPVDRPGFAVYSWRSMPLTTIYGGYDLPLSPDVIRAPTLLTELLTVSQTEVLTTNGLVIRPAGYQNFAELYTDPQYADYPPFISIDSVLHVSQMLFAHTRRTVEQTHLLDELARLDREMFEFSWAQYRSGIVYQSSAAQAIAESALQNAARFAVSLALLDDEFVPPNILSETVGAELALIQAAEGITVSPLLEAILPAPVADAKELYIDYSRFALSEQSEAHARYVRAIIWHEQTGWRLQQPTEALAVVLLTHALDQNNAPRMLLNRLLTVRQFFDGRSSTLTVSDLLSVYNQVWGDAPDLFALADPIRLNDFVQGAVAMKTTQNVGLQPPPLPVDLTWLGTPYALDQAILAQIAADESTTTPVDLSAVYLATAINAPEAYSVVNEMDNGAPVVLLERVQTVLDTRDATLWTASADGLQLGLYRTMLQEKSSAYPRWMRTRAWRRKELQTALGGWVDGRRTVQPMVVARGETFPSWTALWGYVEPQPQVYAQLAAWTQMLIDGLQSRLMLSEADSAILTEWQSWLTILQDIARRELTGQTITDLELQRLTGYGTVIAELTLHALADLPVETPIAASYSLATQTVLDPKPERFRVAALGRVDELYVVVEREQHRFLARGGVYSFYEFDWTDRLPPDDLLWARLLAGQSPSRPAWLDEIILP